MLCGARVSAPSPQDSRPPQAEVELLAEAVRRIEGAARAVWPGCRAALFGSQATGLALPGADLDVVVLGATADLRRAGSGFTKVAPPCDRRLSSAAIPHGGVSWERLRLALLFGLRLVMTAVCGDKTCAIVCLVEWQPVTAIGDTTSCRTRGGLCGRCWRTCWTRWWARGCCAGPRASSTPRSP